MKKNYFILCILMIGGSFYAQVGINTPAPNATLDVAASPTDLTKTDGFIAPRLKGSELKAKDANYTAPQTGAIVYVTEALTPANTTAKTVNVTTLGYFYFDGSVWQKMVADVRNFNYSTTAVPTGETWIDGKKIYKKVYPILLTSFSSVGNITIDTGLGTILDAQFAMKLDNGVYKRHVISAASYNPATGILSQGSTVTDATFTNSTYPITLDLIVTYVEP